MVAYPTRLEAEDRKDAGAAGVALPDFGRSPTLGFVAGGEASDARGSPPSGADMSAFDIAKALIHGEMRRSGIGKAEMARRLELAEPDSAGARPIRADGGDARRADPFAALEWLVGH